MCSTGQVLGFDKKEILIGKDTQCDMIWTQPYISRMHLKIIHNEDQSYTVVDLNSTNGTYLFDVKDASWKRVPLGKNGNYAGCEDKSWIVRNSNYLGCMLLFVKLQ